MKSPASVPDIINEPRLMSQVGNARNLVRIDQCVSVIRVVEVPVSLCLRSNHMSEIGGT